MTATLRQTRKYAGFAAAALAVWLGIPAAAAEANKSLDVVVGPEDTLSIMALDAEEISKQWRVSSSGELNLPLLGRIQAGGMTVRDVEREIATRMKKYYHNPQVTVFVAEFRSQPVSITGEVGKPGVIQLGGPKNLFDVMVQAGGAAKTAGETLTLTRRMTNGMIPYAGARKDQAGAHSVVDLSIKDVMNPENPASQLMVLANDVIHVVEKREQRVVHVSGAVARPGAIELVTQDSISLMKAIAIAGGALPAASKKAVIMHINRDGTQTALAQVDYGRIMKGKVRDIELSDGDVVVLSTSTLNQYLTTAANSAVGSGAFVILGRI